MEFHGLTNLLENKSSGMPSIDTAEKFECKYKQRYYLFMMYKLPNSCSMHHRNLHAKVTNVSITVSAKKIAHFLNFVAIVCGAVAIEWKDVCHFFLLKHMQIHAN
jgi:hypothetical protein